MTTRIISFLLFSVMAWVGMEKTYAKEIYISSSEGCDTNPGTIDKPLKTISGLPNDWHVNSKIYLKRGDVFFDCFRVFINCKIGAYGEGDRPVICGFRVLTNPNAWEKVDGTDNIWKIDLTKNENFKGFDQSSEQDKDSLYVKGNLLYDIGCIYNPKTDSILGNIVSSMDALKRDGQIFTTSYHLEADILKHPFGTVYLRLSKNPAVLGTLCFSTHKQGFATIRDCTVEDIAVVGFASAGAGSCLDGSTIRNCSFDIIGGAVQPDYKEKWVRYGNGIEVWAESAHDVTVEGCSFSRTYDTATTIQGNGNTSVKNVRFINNYMSHCRQAFEYFLTYASAETKFENCEFSYNISYMAGQNGFGCPEDRDANILSYSDLTPPIPIRNNLFYGADYMFTAKPNPLMRDNNVFLYNGQSIINENKPSYNTVQASHPEDYYKINPTDNSHFTVVIPGSELDKKMRTKIEKTIGWKPPKLKLYLLTE